MPEDVTCTELDVCSLCGREIGFGERRHHSEGACAPEVVVRPPGFAGRMPPSPWVVGVDHAERTYWRNSESTADVMRRFEEALRKSSRR